MQLMGTREASYTPVPALRTTTCAAARVSDGMPGSIFLVPTGDRRKELDDTEAGGGQYQATEYN